MTGRAPFELVFGREPQDLLTYQLQLQKCVQDLDGKDPDFERYLRRLKDLINRKNLSANEIQDKYDKQRKKYADKRRKDPIEYQVGNLVLLYIGDRYVGNQKKLLKLYDGPFRVVSKIGPVNYKIIKLEDDAQPVVAHVSKLEKYHTNDEFYMDKDIIVPYNNTKPSNTN